MNDKPGDFCNDSQSLLKRNTARNMSDTYHNKETSWNDSALRLQYNVFWGQMEEMEEKSLIFYS